MRTFRRGGVASIVVVLLAWSGAGAASAAPREWRRVPSPSVAPQNHVNALAAVDCVRSDWCVAVGQERRVPFSGDVRAVIEQWNGATWTMVASPTTGSGDQLRGVSCVADDDCTAVGETGSVTLVEHWDGASWTIVPSPNVFSSNVLEGVACSSATSCVASGYTIDTNVPTALLEQWNGVHWTVVPSLTPDTPSRLNGVTCASPTLCFAVGNRMRAAQRRLTLTLIEMWNGESWSIVKSANVPTPHGQALNTLNGVACSSPSACLAVGGYEVNNAQTTIAQRWDGTKWRLATTSTVPNESEFAGVDCAGTYCAAVGYSGYGAHGASTLVETTRGHDFTVVRSANPGSGYNELAGVACSAAGACDAVGNWATPVAPPWERTLVLSP